MVSDEHVPTPQNFTSVSMIEPPVNLSNCFDVTPSKIKND